MGCGVHQHYDRLVAPCGWDGRPERYHDRHQETLSRIEYGCVCESVSNYREQTRTSSRGSRGATQRTLRPAQPMQQCGMSQLAGAEQTDAQLALQLARDAQDVADRELAEKLQKDVQGWRIFPAVLQCFSTLLTPSVPSATGRDPASLHSPAACCLYLVCSTQQTFPI